MANTPFLDLVKPAGTDRALVSVINSNSDKIDTGVSTLSEQIAINLGAVSGANLSEFVANASLAYIALNYRDKPHPVRVVWNNHDNYQGTMLATTNWVKFSLSTTSDLIYGNYAISGGTVTVGSISEHLTNVPSVVNLSTNLSIDYADAETIGYRTTESTKVDIRNLQGFPTGKTIVCAYPRGYDDIYGAYLWVDNSLYLRGTSKTSRTISVTITVFYK